MAYHKTKRDIQLHKRRLSDEKMKKSIKKTAQKLV